MGNFQKSILGYIAVVAAILSLGIGMSLMDGPSDASLRDRVVKLVNDEGHQCSGEQVIAPSGVSYILTAAHCKVLERSDGQIEVINERGKHLLRRVLAESPSADLLLLEGMPAVKGIKIAKYSFFKEPVRTFTHGLGMDTYRTDGALIQEREIDVPIFPIIDEASLVYCRSMPKFKMVEMMEGGYCMLSVSMTFSTAFIAPGSSGGMVVNDEGKLVGVVSAGGMGYSIFVPLREIRAFLAGY